MYITKNNRKKITDIMLSHGLDFTAFSSLDNYKKCIESHKEYSDKETSDYKEIIDDKYKSIKQLNVIINGENSANNLSLIDVIKCVIELRKKSIEQEVVINTLHNHIENIRSAYDDYTSLLSDEINSLIPIATIHGWKSGGFEEGKLKRDNLHNAVSDYEKLKRQFN